VGLLEWGRVTHGGPAPFPASAVLHHRDVLGHKWAPGSVRRAGLSLLSCTVCDDGAGKRHGPGV